MGEQILVTYKLFTRFELQNPEIASLPSLNGFWTKDLKVSSQFKRDVIDGIAYNVAVIKKSVLTAQKSGKLSIDPLQLKCNIVIQNTNNNRDPFANFGRHYSLQEELISSKPITINVSEFYQFLLHNFNGAVGDMKITSSVDKTTINANEAINYKITITGTGNLELIEPLNIPFPEDFEVYEPEISEKIFEGGLKRSMKIFEYLLIARYKGEYIIPGTNLIVYNPKIKKYETKTSNIHKLSINASINNENTANIQQIFKTEQKDIHYIASTTKLKRINRSSIPQKIFYLIFLLPLLLLLILNIYYLMISKTNNNISDLKKEKQIKLRKKDLKMPINVSLTLILKVFTKKF